MGAPEASNPTTAPVGVGELLNGSSPASTNSLPKKSEKIPIAGELTDASAKSSRPPKTLTTFEKNRVAGEELSQLKRSALIASNHTRGSEDGQPSTENKPTLPNEDPNVNPIVCQSLSNRKTSENKPEPSNKGLKKKSIADELLSVKKSSATAPNGSNVASSNGIMEASEENVTPPEMIVQNGSEGGGGK